VALVRGDVFYADRAGDRELRICFSSVPVQRADDVARRLLRAIGTVRRDANPPSHLAAIG
jgi:DNA-binding transcriptional MocR family regulator